MNCADFEKFVHAYIDREFDDRELGEIDAHLHACERCQALARRESWFKTGLKASLAEEATPNRLKDSIVECINALDPRPRPLWVRYAWAPIPVAVLVGILLFWPQQPALNLKSDTVQAGLVGQLDSASPTPIIDESIDWHRRNLPIEVTGPNGNNVRSWFENKVDFPVRLPAIPSSRACLLGGRLSHIKGQQAAYMLYDLNGSKLSVLVFDSRAVRVRGPKLKRIHNHPVYIGNTRGYSVALVQDKGVMYSLTADIAERDMVALVETAFPRPR